MKNNKSFSLSEVFRYMIKTDPNLYQQMLLQQIIKELPKTIGFNFKFINQIDLSYQILYLHISNPAAKQSFMQNKDLLIHKINDYSFMRKSPIKDIRIL